MIPSTILRLSWKGRPLRPVFEGSIGSIRSHCLSVRAWCRGVVAVVIPRRSRTKQLTHRRHALVQALAGAAADLVGHAGNRFGTIGAGGDDPILPIDMNHPRAVLGDL